MASSADLNNVAVFVRVVDAGGFTSGARLLGIPKSSASRRVRQLEDSLGVRLLNRTTRRLTLTDAGRAYFERVSNALAGMDEAVAAVTEHQDTPRGTVRLAAPSDWGSWLLAPIISRFVASYPDIRVDLSLTNRHVDLVREGFDLALVTGPLADSSLIVRVIGTVDRGLFATEAYFAGEPQPRTVEDLAAHAFIVERPGPTNRLTLTGPDGPRSVTIRGRVATDDRAFMFEAVRAGLGIGLLPASGCVEHLRFVHVLPEYSVPGITTQLVYPSTRHVPQRVALFRDALLAGLKPEASKPPHDNLACAKAASTRRSSAQPRHVSQGGAR